MVNGILLNYIKFHSICMVDIIVERTLMRQLLLFMINGTSNHEDEPSTM